MTLEFSITNHGATGAWLDLANAYDGSGATACTNSTGASGDTTGIATFTGFAELEDASQESIGDPNTYVQSITTTIDAEITSGTSKILTAQWYYDGNPYSEAITKTISTRANYVYEFTRTVDGTFLDRTKLRNHSDDFSLKLTLNLGGSDLSVYEIELELEYDELEYLVGESSNYPTESLEIPLVVNAPNKTLQTPAYAVLADQMNLLGDSIISVQRLLLQDPEYTNLIKGNGVIIGRPTDGFDEVFIYTFVLRGTTFSEYFALHYHEEDSNVIIDDSYVNIHVGQSNDISALLSTTGTINFPFVSGVGWVEGTSENLPLTICPQTMLFTLDGDVVTYTVGLRAYPGHVNPLSGTFGSTSNPSLNVYNPSKPEYYVAGKTFEIRLFGIGNMV